MRLNTQRSVDRPEENQAGTGSQRRGRCYLAILGCRYAAAIIAVAAFTSPGSCIDLLTQQVCRVLPPCIPDGSCWLRCTFHMKSFFFFLDIFSTLLFRPCASLLQFCAPVLILLLMLSPLPPAELPTVVTSASTSFFSLLLFLLLFLEGV